MIHLQLTRLDHALDEITQLEDVYRSVVDFPFQDKLFATSLDLGIVVLLLVDSVDGMIDRIALSNTELAMGAVRASAKPFHEIRIPLNDEQNIIAQSIRKHKSIATNDWNFLFTPALSADQARMNQTSASVECSIVEPLIHDVHGALIFSFFQPEHHLGMDHHIFLQKYAPIVSKHLSRFSK